MNTTDFILQRVWDIYENSGHRFVYGHFMYVNEGNLVVDLLLPLMLKANKFLPTAAENVFVDGSGSCDTFNTQVFLLSGRDPNLPCGRASQHSNYN